ncbi:MAG: aromatic ring-hydroxylating dioxygenase subunit alpha, partial [bacterium]
YDLEDLTWLWTVTTESDKTIILNNQKGVDSKFYEPGPLSNMESFITVFVEWYLTQIRVET